MKSVFAFLVFSFISYPSLFCETPQREYKFDAEHFRAVLRATVMFNDRFILRDYMNICGNKFDENHYTSMGSFFDRPKHLLNPAEPRDIELQRLQYFVLPLLKTALLKGILSNDLRAKIAEIIVNDEIQSSAQALNSCTWNWNSLFKYAGYQSENDFRFARQKRCFDQPNCAFILRQLKRVNPFNWTSPISADGVDQLGE